jgi:hypothetical protein
MDLTDECTELQTTPTNMQDSFTKHIQSIKDANKAKAHQAEAPFQQAEKTQAQETILNKFTTLINW